MKYRVVLETRLLTWFLDVKLTNIFLKLTVINSTVSHAVVISDAYIDVLDASIIRTLEMANIVTFLRLISPSAGFVTHAHTHARKRKILFLFNSNTYCRCRGKL